MMECNNCGKKNDDTASLCSKCGGKLPKEKSLLDDRHPLAYYSIMVGIIITVVIFLFALIIRLSGGGVSPEKTSTTTTTGVTEQL